MRYTFEHESKTHTVNLEPVPSCTDYFRADWERCPLCGRPSPTILRMDTPNPDGPAHFQTCCCRAVLGKRIGLTLDGVFYDLPALSDKLGRIVETFRRTSPELAEKGALDALLLIAGGKAGPIPQMCERLERSVEDTKRMADVVKAAADAKDCYEAALKTRKLQIVIKEPCKEREGIGEARVYEREFAGSTWRLCVMRADRLESDDYRCYEPQACDLFLVLPPGAEFEVFELIAERRLHAQTT